jgi:hypothetical protein
MGLFFEWTLSSFNIKNSSSSTGKVKVNIYWQHDRTDSDSSRIICCLLHHTTELEVHQIWVDLQGMGNLNCTVVFVDVECTNAEQGQGQGQSQRQVHKVNKIKIRDNLKIKLISAINWGLYSCKCSVTWHCKTNICDCQILNWVSEWLLLSAAIFQLYHGTNKLMFNGMMMRSALYYTNMLNWIFTVLTYWNNRLWVDMSPHSDTLSQFKANQYLF